MSRDDNRCAPSVKEEISSLDRSSVRSKGSNRASSILGRQKAKAEAAKIRLEYEEHEFELKKLISDAERRKSEIEAQIKLLDSRKEASVAQAEYEAYKGEFYEHDSVESTFDVPTIDKHERTKQYVHEHSTNSYVQRDSIVNNEQLDEYTQRLEDTNTLELNPHSKHSIPSKQLSRGNELVNFLLKRDLQIQGLVAFDDRPEAFLVWRNSFVSVVHNIDLTPAEKLDLMVKWLGPESKGYASSINASNATNPLKGLERLWERLNERYGSPEMVEAALKNKLNAFPKLSTNDTKKFFELSDILSEIESLMDDSRYKTLFSYYNSSSGVIPIVSKLPAHVQHKWTARATLYKRTKFVPFPPFSELYRFVREMSSMLNDPAFKYTDTGKTDPKPINHAKKQLSVNVRKTDIKHDSDQNLCPLHKTNHSLNQCRQFQARSLRERKGFLREHNICYKCCESDTHIFKNCSAVVICTKCKSDHHPTALHVDSEQTPLKKHGREETCKANILTTESPIETSVKTKCTSVCGTEFHGRSCAKIVLVKLFPVNDPDNFKLTYVILDDQSNRSMCRPELFESMKLNISPHNCINYTLQSCSGTYQTQGRLLEGLAVSAIDNSYALKLPTLLECSDIPDTRSEIPSPEVVVFHQHLRDVDIPNIVQDAEILLLIGRDLPEAHHVFEQRTGPPNSPFAQKLGLGWVIIGDVCTGKAHKPDRVNVLKTRVNENGRPTILPQCDYKL